MSENYRELERLFNAEMKTADADNVPLCSDPGNRNRVDINVEILVGNLQ